MNVILVVGASGRVGGLVACRLLATGAIVRAMSRTPEKLRDLERLGASVIQGDLRDPVSLARACRGVDRVFVTAHAFLGTGDNNPRAVDDLGHRRLIDAARAADVGHVVYTSARGAHPDYPPEHLRIKYQVETYLRASGLCFTILRPAPILEFWAELLGEPALMTYSTTIITRNGIPMNFVTVDEVAERAVWALADDEPSGRVIEIGAHANVMLRGVAALLETRSEWTPDRKTSVRRGAALWRDTRVSTWLFPRGCRDRSWTSRARFWSVDFRVDE